MQLGSWIPVRAVNGQFQSAIGEFYSTETSISTTSSVTTNTEPNTLQLLLKSQAIEYFEDDSKKNNVKVDHITVTEQGFHYLLSSIERDSPLFIDQLGFYSDILFELGQQIAIKIKPHKYQVFSRIDQFIE